MTTQPITVTIEPPDNEALLQEGARKLAFAESLQITTPEEYTAAAGSMKSIKSRWNELESLRKSIVNPLNTAKANIQALFKVPMERLSQAEATIKRSLLDYEQEQERIRLEKERKAAEAAERERQRQEAEARKIEEQARKRREAEEAKARQEEEKGRAEAAEARRLAAEEAEQRRLREAEARRQAARAMPSTPVIHHEAPKAQGVSTREMWSAEVYDLMALVKGVAEGQVPITVIQTNDKALNQMARALKSGLNFPGVKAVKRTTMAARS